METVRLDLKRIVGIVALAVAVIVWLLVREALGGLDAANPADLWGPHRKGS